MHLYFIIRGKRKLVRNYLESLEEVFIRHNTKFPDGSIRPSHTQLVPREVKLIELVFPKEAKDDILKLIGTESYKGRYGFLKKGVSWFGKLFGLQKVEEKENDNGRNHLNGGIDKSHIGTHILGIKEDEEEVIKVEKI